MDKHERDPRTEDDRSAGPQLPGVGDLDVIGGGTAGAGDVGTTSGDVQGQVDGGVDAGGTGGTVQPGGETRVGRRVLGDLGPDGTEELGPDGT